VAKTFLPAATVAAAAKTAGWTGPDLVTAVAVAWGESSGWLEAVNPLDGTYANGRRDFGVWQMNLAGAEHPEQFVLATNAAAAKRLFDDRGWQPWVAYTSGRYRTYLELASAAVASLSYPPLHLGLLQAGLRNNDVKMYQEALRTTAGGVLAQYNPSGATGFYGTETKAMTTHAYTDLLHLTSGDLATPGPTLIRSLHFNPLP